VSSASGIEKVEELTWKAEVDANDAPFRVSRSLWVPTGKKLVTVSDGEVAEESTVELPSRPTSPMTVEDGTAYWGSRRNVWAAEFATGEKLWKAKASANVHQAVAVTDEIVLVSGGSLHAFERDSGEERWVFEADGAIEGAPSFFGERSIVADSKGTIHAVDVATGQESWAFEGPSPFDGVSVAVDGEVAVAGDVRGVVWAVFADRGREKWRFPTAGVISSSVALHGDRVFVANEVGQVFAINARTGQEVWRVEELPAIVTAPVVAGGLVHVGCDDGRVIALGTGEGAKVWEFQLEGVPAAAPTIGNGVVWIIDDEGTVYALE
jgi:outer membrane protein assembly factor BamB